MPKIVYIILQQKKNMLLWALFVFRYRHATLFGLFHYFVGQCIAIESAHKSNMQMTKITDILFIYAVDRDSNNNS